MREKITLQQKLYKRKIGKPPVLLYPLLVRVIQALFYRKLGVSIRREVNHRQYKGPYIIVSNHASRLDYIYASIAFLPHRLNFVAGYNEFFRSHLAFVFRLLQVIPKKNFVADVYAVREISRVLKRGGQVILFPEGMSSISGANQPCAIGSGKLLKHFGLPVLMLHIAGGYLTSTKYCLDERPGRVEVTVRELFSPEALKAHSAEEIQRMLDDALYHDDYAWNKTARHAYDGRGQMAKNLHTLLYRCPRCESEFTMHAQGDTIRCMRCGNGATLNSRYDLVPLDESCVIPETPRVWLDMQREAVRRALREETFELREQVKLGILPPHHYLKEQRTSEIAGEGELRLDHAGFHFNGTRQGHPFSFTIKPEALPTFGMCTDVSRFYTFHEGEFLEFYPERPSTEKWILAVEENHRRAGGKWKDFKSQK